MKLIKIAIKIFLYMFRFIFYNILFLFKHNETDFTYMYK